MQRASFGSNSIVVAILSCDIHCLRLLTCAFKFFCSFLSDHVLNSENITRSTTKNLNCVVKPHNLIFKSELHVPGGIEQSLLALYDSEMQRKLSRFHHSLF